MISRELKTKEEKDEALPQSKWTQLCVAFLLVCLSACLLFVLSVFPCFVSSLSWYRDITPPPPKGAQAGLAAAARSPPGLASSAPPCEVRIAK